MADNLSQIVGRLRMEMNSWTSLEVRVHREQEILSPDTGGRHGSIETHYIETARDQRLLDEVSTSDEGRKRRDSNYCDGTRCAHVLYDESMEHQKQIGITHDFSYEKQINITARPIPFFYLYIEKTPIYEALPKARYLGKGQAMDRNCEMFRFENLKPMGVGEDLVYYLDEATSIPLRVDSFPAKSEHRPDQLLSTWKAQSLDDVGDGHHVVLTSEFVHYAQGQDAGRISDRGTDVVKEIHFDKPFAASTFWPVYEAGVEVVDQTRHTTTRVPGPDRVAKRETPSLPAMTTLAPPVEQPRSWVPALSITALSLGVALIITALVWKRRVS